MKVVERVLTNRIRQQVGVDEIQFVFMKRKGTTDNNNNELNIHFVFK